MKIVYTRLEDGGTSIIHPAKQEDVAKFIPEVAGMTEQKYIEFIRNRDVPADAFNVRIVQDNDIPKDRTFRNALKHDLTHDIDKAVDITKKRLLNESTPRLKVLQDQYFRALTTGAPTQGILNAIKQVNDTADSPHNGMTLAQLKAMRIT